MAMYVAAVIANNRHRRRAENVKRIASFETLVSTKDKVTRCIAYVLLSTLRS